jgi:hypothetical protein
MKTLENPDDKKELLQRLSNLRSDSGRVWGKMSAPQMVCHLNDSYRLVSGEKPASSVENFLTRTVAKWLALRLPASWSRGLKTMPEMDQFVGGTPPGDFEADRRELASRTETFAGKPAYFATARHPFFGQMSGEEWLRWGYLHMDHHLRQFGC